MSDSESGILPWQTALWQRLQRSLAAGRLGHALMLCGPAGLGKEAFARALAQSLLCGERDADGCGCGRCRSCTQLAAGTHPDYVQLAPEGAGRSIQIDAVREFSRQLHLTSQHRRGRVGLLVDAGRMTAAAANSLLKTLEEPPADSYLLLVAQRTAAIPATIRSRCQTVRFPPPDEALVQPWLIRQGIDTSVVAQFRHAPLLAMRQGGADSLARRKHWIGGLADLARDRAEAPAVAEAWRDDDPANLLDWLYTWLLDLLRLRAGLPETVLTNADAAANLKPLAATIADVELERMARAVIRGRALAETQANAQLLLESLLIRWKQMCQSGGKSETI